MKTYKVIFAVSAGEDIFKSYEWGCGEWGELQARHWARDLRKSVEKILRIFPYSQPLAPESEDTGGEIRQVIVGRYRVLFVVYNQTVTILHIRGAFIGRFEPFDSD